MGNTICEGPEDAIYDFNVSALSGYYYVNGHYVVGKDPASCEIMYFSPSTEHKGLVNVTFIADDKVVGTDLFLPLPGRSGQWIPATTQDSLVFGFEDDQKGVWTWITGSEDEGFISPRKPRSDSLNSVLPVNTSLPPRWMLDTFTPLRISAVSPVICSKSTLELYLDV